MHADSPHIRADLLGQMETFPLSKVSAGAPGGKGPSDIPLCTPFLQLQLTLSRIYATGRLGLVCIAAHLRASMLLLLTPFDGGDCVITAAPGASWLL